MDYSAANTALWGPIIQIGIIAGIILFANLLRRKVSFIRKTLAPTAVLGGFILLLLRSTGLISMSAEFLETITYHALAIGFIAMSLRIPPKDASSDAMVGGKSGALIVSTYLVQAIVGLVISLGLAYTVMPELFHGSGVLLAMAYGQGPGQANNVGATYQALGMEGGQAFGLSLAAMGYVCACVVGVVYLNWLVHKGKAKRAAGQDNVSGSVTVNIFQDENEIPVSESVDKLSIQAALIILCYLLSFLLIWGVTSFLQAVAPGLAGTISTLLWGFNFIVGSAVAMGCRVFLKHLRSWKVMERQYQNNYLLSRLSGLAFDVMIVAGIASINISDLEGYWLPFGLMAVLGGLITFLYLRFMCRKLYPDYTEEGFVSMYGMLTGTISSGVLLLREIDPNFETPAGNNLITGSSFGIALGAPVLILVSMAGKGGIMTLLVFALAALYLALLLFFMMKAGKKKAAAAK